MADDEMRERYATVGSAFLGKVAQRLAKVDPDELSPADLARWTDVAMKLQQAGQRHSTYDRNQRMGLRDESGAIAPPF